MTAVLKTGRFYGNILQTSVWSGICLSEIAHAKGRKLPSHTHESAFFCLLLRGSYSEQAGGRRMDSAEIAGKLTASRLTPISCSNCEQVASLTGAAPRCGWWQACRDELYGPRRQASSFHHIRADVPARALQAAGASCRETPETSGLSHRRSGARWFHRRLLRREARRRSSGAALPSHRSGVLRAGRNSPGRSAPRAALRHRARSRARAARPPRAPLTIPGRSPR